MKIQFKKLHPNAIMPRKGITSAAGYDLTAISKNPTFHKELGYFKYISYDTGIAVSIPQGYVGLIFPRSSISEHNLSLANAVGVIDPSYLGAITFRFRVLNNSGAHDYSVGERIGQLLIVPNVDIEWEEIDDLGDSDRGDGGYGSTGL